MINIKLTVIAGGIAAFLSLIIGIFSDVSFGTVFVRALLSGILFAGFFIGISFLIKQFLPELIEEQADEDESVEEGESDVGGNVNIVLDDDDESSAEGGNYAFTAAAKSSNGVNGDSDSFVPGMPSGQAPSSSGMDDISNVEEVEELESVAEAGVTGDVEEVEELASADDPGAPMQDIGEFENTFNAAPSELDSLGDAGGSGSSGSFDVLGGSHDIVEAAQAIQTILKKEQEG
ncbi:MAG: hypothetical protein JEY99_12445 [Spirochaetales bacterium]|nr:hypothetical protein [Spirochaetales bacterium]